ncbi:hypothetical protein TESG_03055 [Trichophyton tonsurans CBS 112818]|uniref:Uncharacterized protein n=1 Tax=Trichophyton tonsurans (strain CBS 112818) TaxID=647933 RepID=F2RWA8_TRIT1|nr:hypothetical protein TESG_03055 [Trichophyton tonsurans CBS 112818]
MASAQGKRIQTNCEVIWGKCDYDIDLETDDNTMYWAVVRKDFGTSFGPPLFVTSMCNSENHAFAELDRVLAIWSLQTQSGLPLTRDQELRIFGGPNGQNNPILK